METKNKIANNIKLLRKEHNLTQEQLAKLTGITLRSIRNYENANHEPNSKSMAALEEFFDVSGAFLRGETEQRKTTMLWDDDDLRKEISDDVFVSIQTIVNKTRIDTPVIQHHIFTILTELSAILNIEDENKKRLILEILGYELHGITSLEKLNR